MRLVPIRASLTSQTKRAKRSGSYHTAANQTVKLDLQLAVKRNRLLEEKNEWMSKSFQKIFTIYQRSVIHDKQYSYPTQSCVANHGTLLGVHCTQLVWADVVWGDWAIERFRRRTNQHRDNYNCSAPVVIMGKRHSQPRYTSSERHSSDGMLDLVTPAGNLGVHV